MAPKTTSRTCGANARRGPERERSFSPVSEVLGNRETFGTLKVGPASQVSRVSFSSRKSPSRKVPAPCISRAWQGFSSNSED